MTTTCSPFLQRFQTVSQARQLTRGITTDGPPIYPGAIAAVFGPVPHQLCEFHILKDVNRAVLWAVAQVRKGLFSSNLKKALTFLGDRLLDATGRIPHIKIGKNVRIREKDLEEWIEENLVETVVKP